MQVLNVRVPFYPVFNGNIKKFIICVEIGELGKERFFDRIYTHVHQLNI